MLLVTETLSDIKYFIVLLLLALMMFGVPVLMLDQYELKDDSSLLENPFNFWLLDLTYTQYMLALGMFEPENYDSHPQAKLCFCFFMMGTFFSQLTMLNMLIAIMGDTFDKVIENREVNVIRMKLAILNDLSAVLPTKENQVKRDTFLLVAKQADQTFEDTDDWAGTIKRLTSVIER